MRGEGWPKSVAMLLVIAALATATPARAEVTIEDPGTYVVDKAGVFDAAQREHLEKWLKELEQKSTAQVKVLTVPTTDGEDFFTFAQRHFMLWKLGQQKKDNGALVVLDVGEHHVRVETGYGLEGALPDSWCGSLSRETAETYFAKGRFGEGLYVMTLAVANKVADDAGVKLDGMPIVRHDENNNSLACAIIFLLFIVILLVAAFINSRPKNRRRLQNWGPTYGGGFGGGFWGDSFNGGFGGSSGGGSFGGGFSGGGSFGGGGSSGGGGGGASW